MTDVLRLRTPNQLRAEVYVLEATIATLNDDGAHYRSGKHLFNDPVPREGQLACADYCSELSTELRQRLDQVLAECAQRGVEVWDPMVEGIGAG